ncbi:cytochrome P450 2F3-like [Hemicordylus capensis]|uniref:cytochrome P450 2F3-like n=1 Tax=Hemicordylus capensis TaxID=884348 RepID=UPI002304A7B1|nr:cytochrome P450 2F3-like [Hemicordylus capensis]
MAGKGPLRRCWSNFWDFSGLTRRLASPPSQGTNVIPFLHSVHNDATQFKEPEKFDPSRFLSEKGSFRRQEAFMPFSTRKRSCLGEALARMEIFLFLTTLLQRFTFQPTCPREELDLSPLSSGIGNVPRPYRFHTTPR